MTPAERFLRAVLAQIRRRGLQRDAAAIRMLRTLARLQDDLEGTLEGHPTDFEAERIPVVLGEVRRHLVEWTRRAVGVADATLEAALGLGAQMVDGPLGVVEVRIGARFIPGSLLEEASQFTASKIRNIGPRALARIDDEIQRMVLGGKTPHQAMKAIAADLGEDHMPFVGFRSETVIRTETGRLHSMAGDRRLRQAAESVPGLGKQWLWSGKSRATHSAANGQVRDVDQQFDVGGEPLWYPRDPAGRADNTINCGCESVPWKADWNPQPVTRRRAG